MPDILDEAIVFAVNAHAGQTRKLKNTPYILHPMEVAAIASTMTNDTDTLIAALLHDTVEDTNITLKDISDRFGERVVQLVRSETEDRSSVLSKKDSWLKRKQDSLEMLNNTDDTQIKILWLSDKLSNLRSFYLQYRKQGEELWTHLNQSDPKIQCWYYESIASAVSVLKDEAAYEEYIALIQKVFYEKENNREA